MKTKIALLTLALAAASLLALPLAAASEAPVPQAERAPAMEQAPDVEGPAETPAEAKVEELLDDGRVNTACNPYWCDNYCKTNYGDWSFGVCSGNACYCAI